MRKKIRNYMGRNFQRERIKDRISTKNRSKVMSKIHSTKTAFEMIFIDEFKKHFKHRFLTNYKKIRGKPDIVILSIKTCIFLDSDFWHGWQYSRWAHLLKNDFWREKISKNKKRDNKTTRYLRRKGWIVVRIWEHQIKKEMNTKLQEVLSILKKNGKT